MKALQSLGSVAAVVVGVWLLAGCAHTGNSASARELFARVQVGMTRPEVDALLGSPTTPPASTEGEAWYLPPPGIAPYQSPYAPGTIGIQYGPDGRVVAKRLNPQFKGR